MLHAFFYGIFLAFGLIMPLGIQNVFLFNQGAMQPRLYKAMPSVITASFCDAILISLAVLGMSVLVLTLPWVKASIFGIGCVFLIYMGWVTWTRQSTTANQEVMPLTTKRQILFAASVSLLNPHALVDSLSIIGTNSLNFAGSARIAFTLACIVVSCFWFFSMSLAGHWLGKVDKSGMALVMVNKISAVIIWGVAFYIGWQFILMM